MHISEVFEHEPLLPFRQDECLASATCDKVGTQCVNIALPMTVTPVAGVGTTTTTCQGSPTVTCVTAADGLSCTLTVTQRVCLNIPVRFSAVAEAAAPTIACAGNDEQAEGGCVCLL